MTEIRAEVLLATADLRKDLPFFTKVLGMRMDMIYPADNPSVAVFSGHGLRVRLDQSAETAPGHLRILTDAPDTLAGGERTLTSPGGTHVTIDELNPPLVLPATQHAFVVRRLADQAPWVIGRAGMALPRPRALSPWRGDYRQPYPRAGRQGAGHGPFPQGGFPADLLHQWLGRCAL